MFCIQGKETLDDLKVGGKSIVIGKIGEPAHYE